MILLVMNNEWKLLGKYLVRKTRNIEMNFNSLKNKLLLR